MPKEEPTVETLLTTEISRADALAIGRLLVSVWPRPGVTPGDRADKLQTDRGAGGTPPSRSLVVREGDRILAHALVFPRTIRTAAGELTIAALAQVCSDPHSRGQNLGATIARAAFELVDEQVLRFALFQTTAEVRSFYERLGAEVIKNRIIDSTAKDPTRRPFWDSVLMRYPADREGWPSGEIDLMGPGY